METTIRENAAGLRSDRALERKKNAEALKAYLNYDAAPALLTENTIRKCGYNWNNLFDDVLEYLLKECEKYETSKSFDNTKLMCSNLLHSTVAGSNKDKAYIKCDKITDACLYFLKNNRLRKAFGDTFLNLLYKHVMPNEHYLGSISPEAWKELLEICIIIYLSEQSIIDDFTNLKLVLVVIQNAVGYCQFISPLVELLPQLRKCFKSSITDKKVQDILVEIASTIIEKLAPEYRLTICEFTESITPTITRFYDQNADKRKKDHLFKFIYLTVVLHHPEGKLENSDGCVAHKWSQWRSQLKNILEIVHLEVNCIQKAAESKFKFQNDFQLQRDDWFFVELSAYVYYVVINSNKVPDESSGPSTKKLRIELNRYKTFSDLIDALQQNPLPWLKIMYSYINKFRESISSDDCVKMLSVLEMYITTNNTNVDWEHYNNIIITILNNINVVTDLQNDPVIVSLLKTSIRYSTSLNSAHKAIHSTIKTILNFGIFNSTHVVPIIKFYNEKVMPVTDSSVQTLNTLFSKYFGKFSEKSDRILCLEWLLNGEYISLKDDCIKELLLRIISKENFNITFDNRASEGRDELYDILFNSVDKCILFNEFQLELKIKGCEIAKRNDCLNIEAESFITQLINEKFSQILDNSMSLLKHKEVKLIEFIKQIRIVSLYCDIILKYKIVTTDEITTLKVYNSFKDALRYLFIYFCESFTSDLEISLKIELLQNLQNILNYNYDQYLNEQIRLSISSMFFHKMERIINSDSTSDINVIDNKNDITEIVNCDLKFNSVYLLAVYCKKKGVHRNEILDLILNPALYNLTDVLDINIVVKCLQLLCGSDVEEIPVELIFALLREMCKSLFRNVQATLQILELLYKILDAIFMNSSSIMKDNCVIMIKGYLSRCQKLYYPPNVAAVILKCVEKIKSLSEAQMRTDIEFLKEGLLSTMNNNINSLRLYCCYLLTKDMMSMDSDMNSALMGIFALNISGKSDISLTDELSNRTTTVLHWLLALTSSKQNLTLDIVKYALKIHHIKGLDDEIVKKVLTKIVYSATKRSLKEYMCNNLIQILEFWFNNKLQVTQLPITFFDFESLDEFIDCHMNVLLPVEILWNKCGKYENSEIVPMIKDKSTEVILETCFPNIIALTIPYVACHHYKIRSSNIEAQTMENAKTLFEYCTRKMDNERFSILVLENVKQFVLLCVTRLCDNYDVKNLFHIDIIHKDNSYYNLDVFKGALKYLGEMIGTGVMEYLCENQPFDVSKIIIKLWTLVLDENIQELKLLSLYRFVVIFQLIPLNSTCDSFVANFACNSLMYAIKHSHDKNEILTLGKALHLVLNHLLPQKLDLIQEIMPSIISTLIIKKEEGYGSDCINLLTFLLVDMRGYLKDSIDLVDGSQSLAENSIYSTKGTVVHDLKSYVAKLAHYSFETLYNLKEYLRNNQQSIFDFYKELNEIKGFSEDSIDSLIHQLINALIHVVKSSSDEKNITEACNCLAEIGICDLKTLVMMPPKETDKVKDLKPGLYFAVVLITCLCDVIFDQDPTVVNCAVNTISSLLNYREGKLALDSPGIKKAILEPFVPRTSSSESKFSINNVNFNELMNTLSWETYEKETYEEWLIKLTNVLLNTLSSKQNYFPALTTMCNTKPIICEKILPSLIGLLIFHSTKEHIQVISTIINSVFQTFLDILASGSVGDSDTIRKTNNNMLSHKHKLIIQCMLDIVDFIRLQRNHYNKWSTRRIETYNYLKLDYKSVAWAANLVDRSITAIFYGELWCLTQNDGIPPSSPDETSKLPGGDVMQKILQKAFISIGNTDAIYGCGTDRLTNEDERLEYLMRSEHYTDSLLVQNIGLTFGRTIETNTNELHYGIVRSLYQSGMQHIALQYIKSMPDNTELNDLKYDCCTQLGDWSIFVDTTDLEIKSRVANANLNSVIKAFRYACLKDCLTLQNIHETDKLLLPLQKAKNIISIFCQKLNMNNSQNVYKVIEKLQLFKEIEDYYLVRSDRSSFIDLLDNWQVTNLPKYHNVTYIETLLSQRSLILEHAAKSNSDLITDIVNVQLSYAEFLLENGKSRNSHRYIAVAKKLQNSGQVSLVEGQLCWSEGHKDIALSLVRRLITEETTNRALNAAVLRQYGNWMVESKYESGREIIDKYLKRSLDVLGPDGHIDTRLKVYYDIAKFADTEYKQVVSYMKSSVFTNKVNCMQNMKGVVSTMRNRELMSKDEKRALLASERLSTLDEAEIDSTFAEKDRFLRLATKYYLLALSQGEENNLSIFRVISLWFENPTLEFEDNQESFEELYSALPSRKFLPVLPQLAPRLTTETNVIGQHLKTILYKCAKDHPHHTLPILFGLKNSYKDMCTMNASAGTHAQSLPQEEEPRVVAARELVQQIREIDDNFTTIVKQLDLMSDAIISLAYFKQEKSGSIPTSEPILKLKNLYAIPVPTVQLPIKNDCTYADIISISSFGKSFDLVGGINCPKKMVCIGSDGKKRTILIKGEDDLRQDAVMQQVFTILNTLLETNAVTSKYKLLVRTYKVVPLSRRSGILEWCEGTVTLGDYLVGTVKSPGAHKRYRPTDISCKRARELLQLCQNKSNAIKLQEFIKILNNLKPVFHYFFTEHYLDPVTWYERRQAYVKSVAVSSMVGYILGLGDRHVNNILIDKKTAEVIHIDFGIAFDQGKVMPTPETVPFRLTQDIIAGFGPSGVEGNFRRSCEKTMQLLRDSQETLLTILEVLLCDPLYAWSVTPGQAKRKQKIISCPRDTGTNLNDNCSGSGGGLAQRALLVVSSKLSGSESGGAHGVFVPGQVARLLRHATDPANLCRLFQGWQPYL